jgi:tRNA A-37 threonylcarbamoyl transferase component Bud32
MSAMTTGSLIDLANLLRHHHLLEPGQLDQLPSLQAATPEPRALAGELIRRGWLTPYQVNQLFRGRGAELLLGSYVLLEKLGEGGMGQVFKAKNWKLGRVVAVKIIRKEKLDNLDAVRRFQREIRAAAQLDHANIVRALDADEVGGTHLLVMEYVEGTDLAKLVKQNGPLPVDQAVACVVQAAQGLAHAHTAGIVHRDIKPANLLLDGKGTVKILDLGLARFAAENALSDETDTEALTHSGNIMGTCDYMAPEQAVNSKRADHRADIYSLGCTLWFLLAGKRLYDGATAMEKLLAHRDQPIPSLRAVRPDVAPELETIFRHMVAKKPEQRYQRMAEAIAALEGRVTEESFSGLALVTEQLRRLDVPQAEAEETRDEVPASGATAGPLRRRWLLAGVGAALAVALLLLGILLASRRPAQEEPVVSSPPTSRTTLPVPPVTFEPEMVRTRVAGAYTAIPYEVVKMPGHFLVGLALTTTTYSSSTVVGSVQPIFRKADGPDLLRSFCIGPRKDPETVFVARDGYAVGGLLVSAGSRVDGLKILFLRIKGDVLDPKDSYKSGWFGGRAPSSINLGGDGNPVVGIYGHEKDSLCQLGLVQANYQGRSNGKSWKAFRQVESIGEQLRECNSDFDGNVYPTIEGEVIVGLTFRTDNVSDLRPLKSLKGLRSLKAVSYVVGRGQLADLRPLRGLPLRELDIGNNQVSSLEPLRNMPLESLAAQELAATDLRPLRGMPLKTLSLSGWKGTDLEPLRGLPLKWLSLAWNKRVTDLGALRGMNLDYLDIHNTGVTDLSPLKEMEVRTLQCDSTCLTAENSDVLRSVKTLESLSCICATVEHLAELRSLKQLRTINGLPAELFWKGIDAPRVPRWQVVSPFPRGAATPFVVPLDGALPAAELAAKYDGKGGQQVGWQAREADGLGRVILASKDDKLNDVSSFAYATVEAPAAGDADLWVGSDDEHLLWLNGVKVHEHQKTAGRPLAVPGDRVRVRLQAGVNHLMIRCDNFSKEWGFAVRVSPDR